jgi:hypothetical protein
MTKQDAAEKIAKLMRLARSNTNPHEAAAARAQARKIVEEHGLSLEELSAGKKAQAFDDLVAAIRKTISSNPEMPTGLFGTSSVVSEILSKLEALSKDSKSKRLDEAYKLVDAASLFNGALGALGLGLGVPLVKNLKKIFDDVLADHDLTPPH